MLQSSNVTQIAQASLQQVSGFDARGDFPEM